jgi:hypothetical protein
LGVSHVTVYKWLHAAGEATPAPAAEPTSGIVQIGEMWHFVNGKICLSTSFRRRRPRRRWPGR